MTIVVAYADTPPGHAAVAAAVAESARERETVIIVPAVRGDTAPDVGEVESRWPDIAGRVEVERGDLGDPSDTVERGDLGDPSDTVVQVAQRRDARLVVLGLRARTPVGKLIFGSTAQRILLDATCPVLAVKPTVAGP